jgi:hypothetical protein
MSNMDTRDRLAAKLRDMWDNDEFIEETIGMCSYERNWGKMLSFIEYAESIGDGVSADEMAALALVLRKEADGDPLPSEVDSY